MDFRDQVKSSVNIVDVIQEHVRLRPSGPNRFMGLCPFHNEKKPSFTVHEVISSIIALAARWAAMFSTS